MSKLTADNLRARASGVETPMVYPVRGSAKAWANYTTSGTTMVRKGLNISSVTDIGTGDTELNFSAAFSPEAITVAVSNQYHTHLGTLIGVGTKCVVRTADNSHALADASLVTVGVLGDLA